MRRFFVGKTHITYLFFMITCFKYLIVLYSFYTDCGMFMNIDQFAVNNP